MRELSKKISTNFTANQSLRVLKLLNLHCISKSKISSACQVVQNMRGCLRVQRGGRKKKKSTETQPDMLVGARKTGNLGFSIECWIYIVWVLWQVWHPSYDSLRNLENLKSLKCHFLHFEPSGEISRDGILGINRKRECILLYEHHSVSLYIHNFILCFTLCTKLFENRIEYNEIVVMHVKLCIEVLMQWLHAPAVYF